MALASAAFCAAAGYIARFGNPLVASDAWYFIAAFLQPAMESGASLGDYYVKRESLDHAQPLHKVLLLLNARWFGLDFVVEAFMGLAFALATFALIAWTTRIDRGLHPPWLRGALLGVLACVLVTLNSGTVFDWSLVTLNYMAYFLVLLAAFLAWRVLEGGATWPLALAAFVVSASLDGVGVVACVALAAATAWVGVRRGNRRDAVRVAATLLLAQLAFRLAAWWLLPAVPAADPEATPPGGFPGMGPEWLVALRIVFGTSIAHIHQLEAWAPGRAEALQGVLAVLALLMHAWFWWRAWKGPACLAALYAIVVMLLFYGLSAGIVYARVPLNGVGYLHQTRYVGIFLLSNVALVLMLLARPVELRTLSRRVLGAGILVMVLGLQAMLAANTWRAGRHLHPYYHKMANQTLALGADPDTVPADCLALVHVCDFDADTRRDITAFLAKQRLNVYSPDFAERYGLTPLLSYYTEPGVAGTPGRARVTLVVRMGPQVWTGVVSPDPGTGSVVEVNIEVSMPPP